jgi:hypothetical protein
MPVLPPEKEKLVAASDTESSTHSVVEDPSRLTPKREIRIAKLQR